MFHKSFPLLVIGLWGVIVLPLPNRVNATTPLTRAEIQNLRNLVQLIPRDRQKKRPAHKSDAMIPGDGLSTGQASLADLRFNDGSLARVGEQAIFQFLPKTRSFRLSNGTALLLIPPGRGETRIQTPSAAAAIRGSALFVRYNQQTDTTIVGALTNSGIEVSNKETSQTQVLQAGQMMVVIKGKFQGLYDFDLRNFYQTSDLVRGFDLDKQNITPTADPAIASVQAETVAALNAQPPITGEGVIENPSFAELTTSPSTASTNNTIISNSPVNPIGDDSRSNSFEDIGQVLLNTEQRSGINSNNKNPSIQNNNVGIDSSRTPTIPQTSPVQQPTIQNTQNTPQPEITTPQPVTTTPQPEITTPQPVTTTPQPEITTPQPEITTPQPEITTPQPVTTTPQPEITTPQPVTTTPQPEITTPQPVITTPQPVITTPQPEITTPQPVITTPQPVITTPPGGGSTTPQPETTIPPSGGSTTPQPETTTPPGGSGTPTPPHRSGTT